MIRTPSFRSSTIRTGAARAVAALALVAVALTVSGCSGAAGGEQGPVQASSNEPADGAAAGLGSGRAGGVSVAGVTLTRSGPGIVVLAQVTATTADELVSLGSNYTQTSVLPKPLPVVPGRPTTIDATTAVLQPLGTINDGATVSVLLSFRIAGSVQVFGTYKA
jgi:hypothetical protein